MTFATASSFLSSGEGPALTFVRAARRSVDVAPRHRAKSIVEDCAGYVNQHRIVTNNKTHILPPQLLLHNRIPDIPPAHPVRKLHRLLRIMLHHLLRVRPRLLEPEEARDLAVRPEWVRDGGQQCERRRTRPGLPVRDHLLHEPLVLRRLAVVERRALGDLPAREPDEGLGAQQTAREVVEDLGEEDG